MSLRFSHEAYLFRESSWTMYLLSRTHPERKELLYGR